MKLTLTIALILTAEAFIKPSIALPDCFVVIVAALMFGREE